ncbi:MAG: hypothetical protein RLY97_1483 [Pseudomonadota bacterium]|jgi:enoyl-CoA hydratase/carnithine racemase
MPLIEYTIDSNGVADVRLNRPEKRNALTMELLKAIVESGEILANTKGLRAVVLSGNGQAFCAGLDLSNFTDPQGVKSIPLAERTHGNANLFQQTAVIWRKLPVPVIAAIHGTCFGGGLQIAAGADIRIAAPDASLCIMEMKWGLVPDMGHFALWRGIVAEDVLRSLTYSNQIFTGTQAQAHGFVTTISDDPLTAAKLLSADIAMRNPDAIRATKFLFNSCPSLSFDEILQAESHAQAPLLGSANQMEAVMSQMQKRPAQFIDP